MTDMKAACKARQEPGAKRAPERVWYSITSRLLPRLFEIVDSVACPSSDRTRSNPYFISSLGGAM